MITDAPSLTHRPMKNKAGTAAGNPRARADRASPTMNGNPNAQVRPICFHIHIHHGRRHVFIHFSLIVSSILYTITRPSSRFHHFSMVAPAVCFSALLGFRALVRAGGGAQFRGVVSQVFGFGPQRPGPWPCAGATVVAGPPVADPTLPPTFPLVRCGRVIPAHLITGHKATPSLPRCLKTASDRTVPNDHLYQHPTNMLIQVDNDDFCSACGGNGEIVCCDGCTRAFHQLCHDPFIPYSVLSDEDEEWYCWDCSIKRDPGLVKQHKGPWGPLMTALDKKHAVSYRLPKKTREYFEGVRTGPDGEYEDFVPQPKGAK